MRSNKPVKGKSEREELAVEGMLDSDQDMSKIDELLIDNVSARSKELDYKLTN